MLTIQLFTDGESQIILCLLSSNFVSYFLFYWHNQVHTYLINLPNSKEEDNLMKATQ